MLKDVKGLIRSELGLKINNISPVLLCGGSGTRLWPLSRADMPKQLQALSNDETMLQETALRVSVDTSALKFERPLIVAAEAHRFLITDQLMAVGIEPRAMILEPQGRNTAPAVALAAYWLAECGQADALMLVMPSDHLIGNEAAFREAIASAAAAATAGRLVTFGITPNEPATGYGYIEHEVDASSYAGVHDVRRFVEKPDAETAARYVSEGLVWNAGIFLLKASTYLEALKLHAPEVADCVEQAISKRSPEGIFLRPEASHFQRCPSISIDYAVMERSAAVSVVPVDMGWSDVGSWDALWRVTMPDAEGNVIRGQGALIGCTDSLVRNDGGPFVAALGLENMIVVSTGDAVLIAPRNRAEDIRKVVDRIEAEGLDLARTSHEVRRPWGSYCGLGQGNGWRVKRIAVLPGGRLSLQKHDRREEIWVVASGKAQVTVGEESWELIAGQSVHIPVGAVHRLENYGPQPLELVEVQLGSYFGEDDIIRISDIYGRADAAQSNAAR